MRLHINHINGNEKIQSIKAVREIANHTRLGLKEAKELVEKAMAGTSAVIPVDKKLSYNKVRRLMQDGNIIGRLDNEIGNVIRHIKIAIRGALKIEACPVIEHLNDALAHAVEHADRLEE